MRDVNSVENDQRSRWSRVISDILVKELISVLVQ